jgi:hypothetical protein
MIPLPLEAVDCHLHAGLERRESLEEIFRYLREDGRKAVGLVDHAELYREDPPPWAEEHLLRIASREDEAGVRDLLVRRLEGPAVFYDNARRGAETWGGGIRVAVGLEVHPHYLARTPPEWLDGAEFLGVCTNQPEPVASWGGHMADVVREAEGLRGGRELPLILHHPFRWRLFELARSPLAELPEAGGFTALDARIAARALAGAGALAEVNFASYWHLSKDERAVGAARGAFTRLRDAGARFSVGSDLHSVSNLPCRYEPGKAVEAFGLAPEDLELPGPFA